MNNLPIKRDGEFNYSSTQLDLNTKDKQEIQSFITNLINPNDLYIDYGVESQSHITVLYGLYSERPSNHLNQLISETDPITIMLGKTSIFDSNPDYDVLKLDVVSGDLRRLNKLLSFNLEVTNDYPNYVPHLTLAYLTSGSGQKYINDKTFEDRVITFDRLTFSPSSSTNFEDTYLYFKK